MKKLTTTKFHNFSRSTAFILTVFSNEVIWIAQKNQFPIISIGGFLNKPPEILFLVGGFLGEPPVEIHDLYMRFS